MTAATSRQGSKVTLSYEGIGEMLRSEFMQEEMKRRADRVRDLAEATAPVGPENDPHRGEFKGSFRSYVVARGGRKNDRAAGIVENDAPYAVHVEFGTSRTRGHHTLRNALRAAAD
jgi:hypothetical protein